MNHVFDVLRAITVLCEPEELVELVVNKAQSLLEAAAAVVILRTDQGYRVESASGFDPGAVVGLESDSFRTVQEQLEAMARGGGGWEGFLGVPMVAAGMVIGALCVFGSPRGRFSDEDTQLLSLLADQVSVVLDNARLHQALRRHHQDLYQSHHHVDSRLKTVLEHMADGLLLFGPDGPLLQSNRAARTMLELGQDGTLGVEISVAGPGGWVDCWSLEMLYRLMVAAGPGAMVHLKVDSIGRWYDAVCTPSTTPEGLREYVVLLRDVTHYRRVEDLKASFLSMAAHEIRTPVTAIHGYLSLLLSGRLGDSAPLPGAVTRALQAMQSNVERLLLLISDLLDVTRMDGPGISFNSTAVDVRSLIDEVLEEVSVLAENRHITVKRDVPELGHAFWDQQRVAQVMLNLLSNALKFTPEGGEVEVSAQAGPAALVIRVADSGPGIHPSQHRLVFEPFWRGDHARQTPGSGLGLAICKRIVDAHLGRIWVESQVGAGATFIVELPRRLEQAAVVQQRS